ncbi:hypothetical protein Tco_1195756 [Tanacetum coccineum]
MDNIRPRTSSFSPSKRFSTTRTPHRPQRPKKIMKSIWVKKASTVGSQAVLPQNVSVKRSAMINPTQTWRPKGAYLDSVNRDNGSYTLKQFEYGNPEEDLKDYAIIDSGCSGSMTGDKDKLSDFKEFKGGYVAFGNDPKGGRITGKGTIKTSCIDFEKVSYVEELKFNLLSVSQIYDKKHNVLVRTDKDVLILSPKFKFVDEDLVILRAPRKNDVYSLDLKNIIPSGGVTCLVAKATKDEAVLWHRRLGLKDIKNIKKIGLKAAVRAYLVKGKKTMLIQEEKYQLMMMLRDLDETRSIIVHGPTLMKHSLSIQRNVLYNKEVALSSEEQALHMSLKCFYSDDDVPKYGVFSTNSFNDENTDNEEDGAPDYNNMDHTIDVSSTPTIRIPKNPSTEFRILGKSTAGVLTGKIKWCPLQALADESLGLKHARRTASIQAT